MGLLLLFVAVGVTVGYAVGSGLRAALYLALPPMLLVLFLATGDDADPVPTVLFEILALILVPMATGTALGAYGARRVPAPGVLRVALALIATAGYVMAFVLVGRGLGD